MLKKILLAMDGSENAERALPWIKRYAGPEKAQVVLFRSVDTEYLDREFIASELQEARNYLLRIEKELNYAGLPTKMIVRQGRPAREIVRTAVEEGCDLILMTTRGGSKVQRWILGGVTEQVLRMSPIPVFPVRSQTSMPKQGHIRRIIVPVDGSKLAEAVVPWAKKLAQFLKARLVFLHVYSTGSRGISARTEETFDLLRKRMIYQVARLKEQGVKAMFKLQRGDAADRILKFADRDDLVLTTTHGFGGFKRWVFGSVAEKLIHEAQIPILVYKTVGQASAKALVEAS
ncbi:MAG TPA: universal stress protein [Planctomycetota bacterium]|nr:universal stress protein [Planctomycetota bacterium]